jgi:hypothetical protein
MRYIAVNVEDEIHEAFEEEARRRSKPGAKVSLAAVVRNELAKSAARFRRNAK